MFQLHISGQISTTRISKVDYRVSVLITLQNSELISNGNFMMSLCLSAVLKKSQKEASSLIRRNGKGRPTDVYGSENSNNSTNVEFDVMGQWTSLFLNMEGILARESSHLVSSSRASIRFFRTKLHKCSHCEMVSFGYVCLKSVVYVIFCSRIAS